MAVTRKLLIGVLIVALPVVAGADVIPISDVNENDVAGLPVLRGEVVTVRGVVTVGTGALADTTDIYVQDATGGVNVLQRGMASPIVARGDSLEVIGVVDHATSNGRTCLYVISSEPGTRMRVLNSGNPLPDPVELTPEDIATDGESYEGIYAVLRGVGLEPGFEWVTCGEDPVNSRTQITDGAETCWMWFSKGTDICGSEAPLEQFEVHGVVVPDIRLNPQNEHGIMPPSRGEVLSVGPGSGYATVSPDWAYTGEEVDLSFDTVADGGTLTQVSISIHDDWTFSGSSSDVLLDGPGLAGAMVVATTDFVVLTGCALTEGSPGAVTLTGVDAPDSAGPYEFEVKTADAGGDPVNIQELPVVGVGALAASGTILINELYAHSGGGDLVDRSEFIELYNPGAEEVDLSGWVLTDMDDSGACGGSNLWEFPVGTTLAADGYLVVAKDSKALYGQGFWYLFGSYPDFELYDPYHETRDPSAPIMNLVSPDDQDPGTSQEIRLIGGADGTGSLFSGIPGYEAVFLYSDRTLVDLVDAVEYRDPVLTDADPCVGVEGLGGADDAWTPGPPPWDTSLCRDDVSTDTDVSRDDFFLAPPTPWGANPASDTTAPSVNQVAAAGRDLVIVEFSEPVDEGDAANPANYVTGGGVVVNTTQLSRNGRTVLLKTSNAVPGTPYSLDVYGVEDIAGNPMAAFSGSITTSANAVSIAEVQAYDEEGLSILSGQDVSVVGFTTVPPGVFQPDRTNMYIQEDSGWGVNIFSFGLMAEPALEGDLVGVAGEVLDYISSTSGAGATTEVAASSITVLARGFEPLEPAVMPSGDVGQEENEGRFVRTSGVVVSVEGFAIYINDGSGAIQIYQNFNDLDFGVFAVGDSVQMTGVVLQYDQSPPFLAGYELSPRYDTDMVTLTAHYAASADIDIEARVLDVMSDETVEISYNAPRASHVTVRIYDMKGREIATVFDGMCLGPQRTTWDARDDNGRKVPIGVYLCHVMARDRVSGDGSDAAVPIVVGTKLD